MSIPIPKRASDLTRRRFGRLVVCEPIDRIKYGERCYRIIWRCLCDCGNASLVQGPNLVSGHTRSCGCLEIENRTTINLKHGNARAKKATPEYRLWTNIKKRCFDANAKTWADYGGRGISMFPAWQDDFEAFLAYIGQRPSDKHSLDRINNDGHYEPGNVRWATKQEQNNNRRDNRLVTANGMSKTVSQWARENGVSQDTIYMRLNAGWNPTRAVTAPLHSRKE